MLVVKAKQECCGCEACVQVCPKKCIVMNEDKEGFLYPHVDRVLCVDCHLCEKVCPVINQGKTRNPSKIYAARNKDEQIRLKSSSGGVFTLLAEKIIDEGGVVFGACFDEKWEVKHTYAENKKELSYFRGSKYVQSRIESAYLLAERFLKQGRKVLFSGTPCQIAGLKKFLRTKYVNLITVDFVCHGVPSPKVWRMYLDEIVAREGVGKNTVLSHLINREKKLQDIEFRSKSTGWKKYSFALTFSEAIADGEKNSVLLSRIYKEEPFMKGFLRNTYLRPSCYHCPAKNFKSHSEYTLADFWGVEKFYPELDDDKGISLVFVHSDLLSFSSFPSVDLIETTMENALNQNPSIIKSAKWRKNRELFFSGLSKGDVQKRILKYAKWDVKERLRYGIIKILIHLKFLSLIKNGQK